MQLGPGLRLSEKEKKKESRETEARDSAELSVDDRVELQRGETVKKLIIFFLIIMSLFVLFFCEPLFLLILFILLQHRLV